MSLFYDELDDIGKNFNLYMCSTAKSETVGSNDRYRYSTAPVGKLVPKPVQDTEPCHQPQVKLCRRLQFLSLGELIFFSLPSTPLQVFHTPLNLQFSLCQRSAAFTDTGHEPTRGQKSFKTKNNKISHARKVK